ncbi:MAG TPA: hypothetical protein PK055_06820 [Gammaproteobacteria bacterium]|nr:hypothetical protein [Xanthomonadales bacterium]HOP22949.1 hypothetical protein [Gammaproteobacteria bacterium]HPI95225.1 hypothetical protein [Gammaproteobacteria bacterium]HPQ87352.1 hypothetical protein [Gammaproteobacteria bacterium]
MSSFFKYRLSWYKLKTREFVLRYKMALMIVTLFLPGVAIGDNFYLLLKFLTQPFVIISSSESSLLQILLALIFLLTVFLVWVRAQKTAIIGGEFSEYLRSLPLPKGQWIKSNLTVLLLSNHLLWVIIFASYFYLKTGSASEIIKNTLVLVLLIACQYRFIFLPTPLVSKHESLTKKFTKTALIRNNFYLQMLFQSDLSTTLFRFVLFLLFIAGFRMVAAFFAGQNNNELLPYLLIAEFLFGYFFSGFFITFKEQRQAFGDFLQSLPVKTFFWMKKDVSVVLMLSIPFHLLLYVLLHEFVSFKARASLFLYYVFLILLSYPLRMKLQQQTFFSFMTLLVITIITIFNLT